MRHATLLGGTAIAMFASILLVPALAQRNATPSTPGPSAAFNPATLPEQEIGQKFTVKAKTCRHRRRDRWCQVARSLSHTKIKGREYRTDLLRRSSRPGSSIRAAC